VREDEEEEEAEEGAGEEGEGGEEGGDGCDIWGDLGIASWRWSGVSERENVITTLL